MSFELKVKRIDAKAWQVIKESWVAHVPSINPVGSPPSNQISEIPDVASNAVSVPKTGESKFSIEEMLGSREAVLHEGIFLLHKAISVSGATQFHSDNGFSTWSLSSGYHTAFFAVKSILCFLGVSLPRINNVDYVLDVWPKPEEISKNQLKKGIVPERKIKIIRMGSLPHYRVWKIFQRVLFVSDIDLWDQEIVSFFKKIDENDFALQRNNIHYHNNHWKHNGDLATPSIITDFGKRNDVITYMQTMDVEDPDFSIILGFILIKYSYRLFSDMVSLTGVLQPELDAMNNVIASAYHNTYRDLF